MRDIVGLFSYDIFTSAIRIRYKDNDDKPIQETLGTNNLYSMRIDIGDMHFVVFCDWNVVLEEVDPLPSMIIKDKYGKLLAIFYGDLFICGYDERRQIRSLTGKEHTYMANQREQSLYDPYRNENYRPYIINLTDN